MPLSVFLLLVSSLVVVVVVVVALWSPLGCPRVSLFPLFPFLDEVSVYSPSLHPTNQPIRICVYICARLPVRACARARHCLACVLFALPPFLLLLFLLLPFLLPLLRLLVMGFHFFGLSAFYLV